jgi:hypothetical protein
MVSGRGEQKETAENENHSKAQVGIGIIIDKDWGEGGTMEGEFRGRTDILVRWVG